MDTTIKRIESINEVIDSLTRLRDRLETSLVLNKLAELTNELEQNTQGDKMNNTVEIDSVDYGVRLPAPHSKYSVTEDGRVFSHIGKIKELKPSIGTNGYKAVKVVDDNGGGLIYRTIHYLVTLAYYGPRPSDKPVVRHLDGDKYNNNVHNLRYGTHRENAQDTKIHNKPSKKREYLTADDVRAIRLMHSRGFTISEIMEHFPNFSRYAIHSTATGRAHKNI